MTPRAAARSQPAPPRGPQDPGRALTGSRGRRPQPCTHRAWTGATPAAAAILLPHAAMTSVT